MGAAIVGLVTVRDAGTCVYRTSFVLGSCRNIPGSAGTTVLALGTQQGLKLINLGSATDFPATSSAL